MDPCRQNCLEGITLRNAESGDFPGSPGVKNPPSIAWGMGLIPGQGTEEPGGLQSVGSQRVGHN